MKNLVIFGTEKMAKTAHFYFTRDSDYEVAAFTVDRDYLDKKEYLSLPVVAFEEVEKKYPPSEYAMFIAVGYENLNKVRSQKYSEAKEKGYTLATYFSSHAIHLGDVQVGDNCFILENQVFQYDVVIGNDVVIWSGNHFGHEVVIGDHVWLSSHIVLSGGVSIKDHSFVGVNVAFRDKVSVGKECIVGAGAVILNDVVDREVYVAKSTERYRLDSIHFEKMMNISKR